MLEVLEMPEVRHIPLLALGPFGFDLTPHLRFDGPNVLAVMADNRFQRDPMDPALAPQAWAEHSRESRVSSGGIGYAIVDLRRRAPQSPVRPARPGSRSTP